MMKKIFDKLAASSPEFGNPEAARKALESALLDRIINVAIDPKTARPYRVRFEERILVGGEDDRQLVRDTQFDWNNAECQ